jgi:hypothetical protein
MWRYALIDCGFLLVISWFFSRKGFRLIPCVFLSFVSLEVMRWLSILLLIARGKWGFWL